MTWPDWDAFHFLRADWLWAIPVGMLLIVWLSRYKGSYQAWRSVIDNQLLNHLMDSPASDTSRWRRWSVRGLAMGLWALGCMALAGPTWEKVKQPVVKKEHALVLILDLSLSMLAEDQTPSRLVAAKRKLTDILALRKEGMTGLVVYSGDAHVVSPLTDDINTIKTLIPPLEPSIMPKYGSNFRLAMEKTQELLQSANISQADILLLTDEVSPTQFKAGVDRLKPGQRLCLLTFGTQAGAPIPFEEGFFKNNAGTVVMAKLNASALHDLGRKHGVIVLPSTLADTDLKRIMWMLDSTSQLDPKDTAQREGKKEREFDLWEDRGYWLAVLMIPLALFGFRRGVSFCLLLSIMTYSSSAQAWTWQDLWKTKDHQGFEALRDGNVEKAADTFEHDQWQGTAKYLNKDYEGALEQFSQDDTARGAYNRGNALAKLGRYEEAIKAYNEAIEKKGEVEDATHNRDLVQRLLDQQNDQQKKQGDKSKDKQGDKNDKQDKNKQSGDNQDKNQGDEKSQQQNGQEKEGDQQDQQASEQKNGDEQDAKTGQSGKPQTPEDAEQEKKAMQQQAQEDAAKKDDKKQTAMTKPQDQTQEDNKDPQQALTQAQQQESLSPLEKERRQALKQWLRKIPDDPGQLLRNKFQYQSEINHQRNDRVDKESEQLW